MNNVRVAYILFSLAELANDFWSVMVIVYDAEKLNWIRRHRHTYIHLIINVFSLCAYSINSLLFSTMAKYRGRMGATNQIEQNIRVSITYQSRSINFRQCYEPKANVWPVVNSLIADLTSKYSYSFIALWHKNWSCFIEWRLISMISRIKSMVALMTHFFFLHIRWTVKELYNHWDPLTQTLRSVGSLDPMEPPIGYFTGYLSI